MSKTFEQLKPVIKALDNRIKVNLEAFPTDTAEGAIASFSDGADAPVNSLVVDVEPAQSGTGDPTPENIRPISGRTGGNITLCGKNFLKNTAKSHTTNGVSYVVNADGTITASGKPTGGNGRCDVCNISNPSKALLDTFSGKKLAGCPEGGGTITYSAYRLQLIIDGVLVCADFGDSVQIPDLSQYYGASNLYIDATVRPAHTGETLVFKPIISEDATYDTYVPYSGESYAVTFPNEAGGVYGGAFDVVSGVLTVDKTIVKLGDFTWYTLQVAGENVYQVRNIIFPEGAAGDPPKTWCEALKTMPYGINSSYQTLDNILWPHVNGTFLVRCSSYADAESFKEAMQDINLVVPRAPQTFQLTPTEVKSLLGINNIYADCGNVSVEYRTDTTAYVAKEIASVYNSIHNIGSDYVIGPDFRKRNVTLTMLGKLKYLQAFCIYNGHYYSTDGSHIAEQDEGFGLIRDVAISVGHGNAFQLGTNGKAYISGWDDHKIYVVDLPTLTIDSVIDLPTTTGYTTCAVDELRQLAYIFQTDAGPFTVGTYNFIVYDYDNQHVVSTTRVSERFAAMQAVDCYMDLIVGLSGGGTESAPNDYRIYTKSGNMVGKFVIGSMSAVEPEGVFIDRSSGDVYMSINTRDVYKLDILA